VDTGNSLRTDLLAGKSNRLKVLTN